MKAARQPLTPGETASILRLHHVEGWPVGTIVRGHTVMWQGELVTPSVGRPMRFLEAL